MRVGVLSMGTIVEVTGVTRDEGAEKQHVAVVLSELAFEALTSDSADAAASVRMASALRCYLGDRGTDQPAWPYPAFLRGSEPQRDVQVELEVAEDLWRAFTEEAVRQGVTIEQLAEHAAFYFAAELNAGRVTQRILDDLESTEGGGAAD
jgi:hypothetical protein